MSRRTTNRRGLKKRGIFPSFGDMVLPVVGVAALALLVLAGRHFFVKGIQTSPEITSTQAYADSPAVMAERKNNSQSNASTSAEKTQPSSANTPKKAEDKAANENTILAVAENTVNPKISDVKPAVSQPAKTLPEKIIEPKKNPAPAMPRGQVNMTNLPPEKQWRVQVGAYPSRAEAEKIMRKIKLAGYPAKVYQNPASKHVKVWVEAGENRYQASLMVDAMKKLGFKSSFSFPPMKQ